MKKLLLVLLTLSLCACGSNAKKPTIVADGTVQVALGTDQIVYRKDVCAIVKITDEKGENVDYNCDELFFANGINKDEAGTYDVRVVYSELSEKIETTVKIEVVK